ncbi:MAG: hypothetical protein JOZ41_10455 [Chloroflexi bacterium]|nr:hypothetical protein [Chloroflexota bacterium]
MTITANPALEKLGALVGEWEVELRFPAQPPGTVLGRASFQWLEDGAFLLYRLGDVAAGPPYSISLIGGDDSAETYTVLYADDRRVSRIYQMRLDGGEWAMWREAPGFWQRFTGTFGDGGDTIAARWEKSPDGVRWEHDFDLTYRRLR